MRHFELVERPEQPTAVVHETVPVHELPDFFARAYQQVAEALAGQGTAPVGPPFALYFGMPGKTVEVEAGFPVQRPIADVGAVHPGHLPGGKCLRALHVGPYGSMTSTYAMMQRWMSTHHLTPHREVWETYLSDPRTEPNASKWRTEVVWPVD